ncbi:MAG: hypothetical protein J6T41_04490 [Neisseriaceae bacterium]|nr:hypothetical protein [Neisseriaceae bacterium]
MNRFVNHHQQQGFSLVMVMMIMVVIALLVIAGAQVSNTEMRISTNNADQKYAKGLAERALLAGEDLVTQEALVNDPTAVGKAGAKAETDLADKFPAGGSNGLYGYNNTSTAARTAPPLWEQDDTWNDTNSIEAKVRCNAGCKNPRYIVEYLGIKDVDGEENLRVFRITARAWGENENTVSTVQSVIVAPSS